MENLSESNFLVYAMHNYDTPVCLDLEEFNNDLKEKWNWHNEFYEQTLEQAIPLLLKKSYLEITPSTFDLLKKPQL